MHNDLTRRDVLKSIGGAGIAAVFSTRALQLLGDEAEAASTCLLTPEVTEGPYWVEHKLMRRNITEGKAGLPLVIRFTVLNAKTCTPIKNADVEIWHCDALGNYSAVNGATTRYLRGHQKSRRSPQPSTNRPRMPAAAPTTPRMRATTSTARPAARPPSSS